MRMRKLVGLSLLLMLALALVSCGGAATSEAEPTSAPAATDAPAPPEVEVSGSVSEGGLLYDKWWKAAGVDEPAGDQALWATQSTNTRSGADTWRCPACRWEGILGFASQPFARHRDLDFEQQLATAKRDRVCVEFWMNGTEKAAAAV